LGPGVLGLHVPDGGFHVKAAGLPLARLYVAVKLNANFPANGPRRGLPTIQGVLVLSDGETGRPLALMDSMEITVLRTGAATAVGADDEYKVEIEPVLMAAGTIVVDSLEQCATIGDLHHALASGVLSPRDVHAVLADVVGRRPGRTSAGEITIFDSTGVAIEDVAAAAAVYERAIAAGRGLTLDLAGSGPGPPPGS